MENGLDNRSNIVSSFLTAGLLAMGFSTILVMLIFFNLIPSRCFAVAGLQLVFGFLVFVTAAVVSLISGVILLRRRRA